MNKIKPNVVIFVATFLSASVFAAAPVNDVTVKKSDKQLESQLQELTRLLEARNKMQVRLQNQLDGLSQEMNQIKGGLALFNHKIEQIENRQRNLYQLIEEKNKPSVAVVEKNNRTANAPENEKVAYQRAVDLVLVNKDYDQAITAFEAFVIDNPKSSYVANSQYWLGQLLYKQGKRTEARTAFLIVVEQFPDSSKRPDASFKIGIIDEYLGNITSAKDFYQKVLKEYPDTSAAGLAEKRLQAL
ncbi:tol-pal system protein YbgF [Psychromonas antarctica]|jgi:tol-pal system protein YbgF|uniref:tol-pal system protein YbgF n=1 Tax=Psychromonas antarctica TaxID=67573 RepID=UPI001EE977B9|nr:tol-pal system protein YbgF [Psychromonas antarctica]MCG6202433.1 tol-pal system protein YbgF [Psychromonas antarctica]